MIGWLSGRVVEVEENGKLILDVEGVGYEIEITSMSYDALKTTHDKINIHIHTVVREDAFLLYGFINKDERELFRLLIKVNGIGPKTALAILSNTTPDTFIQSIVEKNINYLAGLPGIGKKTAERLAIEMKDRFDTWTPKIQNRAPLNTPQNEAITALQVLGYSSHEAAGVVKKILVNFKDLDENLESLNVERLIRESLKSLAQKV